MLMSARACTVTFTDMEPDAVPACAVLLTESASPTPAKTQRIRFALWLMVTAFRELIEARLMPIGVALSTPFLSMTCEHRLSRGGCLTQPFETNVRRR